MAAQPGRKRKSNCLGTDEVGIEEQRKREAGKQGVDLGMESSFSDQFKANKVLVRQ